ncbi:MAG: hypothetical protein H0X54_07225 [Propionibacteriales bacterium]|jgi:hypothetical protein|nr:hypothetical protein [Propionibacteriales bacterium]
MSKALWFAAGAASGVYGLVKVRRTAQALTPDGVGARVAAWQVGVRAFGDEVRAGMVERETQLRDQLRLGATGSRQIENPPGPTEESREQP